MYSFLVKHYPKSNMKEKSLDVLFYFVLFQAYQILGERLGINDESAMLELFTRKL